MRRPLGGLWRPLLALQVRVLSVLALSTVLSLPIGSVAIQAQAATPPAGNTAASPSNAHESSEDCEPDRDAPDIANGAGYGGPNGAVDGGANGDVDSDGNHDADGDGPDPACGPPPAVPEAPFAIMLPGAGLLAGGAWLIYRRRRSVRNEG
jgi:hypothetical protein